MDKIIEDFLNLIDECQKKYDWAFENVHLEDQRSGDLLHALEFEDDPEKRAQIAERLHQCRTDRREYKDTVGQTYIVNYWTERNQNSINYLRETLGRLRKEIEDQKSRKYTPRIEDASWFTET